MDISIIKGLANKQFIRQLNTNAFHGRFTTIPHSYQSILYNMKKIILHSYYYQITSVNNPPIAPF